MVEDMNVSYSLPHESDVERYGTTKIKQCLSGYLEPPPQFMIFTSSL